MELVFVWLLALAACASGEFLVLEPGNYREHFTEGFPGPWANGSGVGSVNASSFDWAIENLPLFECSDDDITAAYWYRAKVYKSHLVPTDYVDLRHVVSEFGPSVSWGGPYGTINAAAGHHISEGRWLRQRSYMDGLVRFWIGSQVGGVLSDGDKTAAFEPGVGHFANGTRGAVGSTPYSSWILSAAVKVAAVRGDWALGTDVRGGTVGFADMLPLMVRWWEQRSLQLRVDCILANNGATTGPDTRCLDGNGPPILAPPAAGGPPAPAPVCYIMADGWDAMEGSVSGNGCRPTINAMMFDEALAIATVANATGNTTLGARFTHRAERVRSWYLRNMWNAQSKFFGVFKQGVELTGMGGCTASTLRNETDDGCCCVARGRNVGHYANFSVCPAADPGRPPDYPVTAWPGNATACAAHAQAGGRDRHSSSWPCDAPVAVRELLGLGPFYYHNLALASGTGPTAHDGMWGALFGANAPQEGFWGAFGPTTVERRATCFNKTQDMRECNWAGPSWPYETSRVLAGLANFAIDYPAAQSRGAGVGQVQFTRLLRAYARSMTRGTAVNGSRPWVGENIEPDTGYWIARSVMYRGGDFTIDANDPWLPASQNPHVKPANCSACEGTCYDRGWSDDGRKCDNMNETLAKSIGPCDLGCSCVPPDSSYDYRTHGSAPCCHWGSGPWGQGSCDGHRVAGRDKDRGKDYLHSTYIDNIVAGLVGLRAASPMRKTNSTPPRDVLVVQPLADADRLSYFAMDNLAYHGRNVTVIYDPGAARWGEAANCSGLCVFVDGEKRASAPGLARLSVPLG